MDLDAMARVIADQQRLMRQLEPTMELMRRHEESLRHVTQLIDGSEMQRALASASEAGSRLAEMSREVEATFRAAGIGDIVAQWRHMSGRFVEVESLFPRKTLTNLQEIAESVRRSMPCWTAVAARAANRRLSSLPPAPPGFSAKAPYPATGSRKSSIHTD